MADTQVNAKAADSAPLPTVQPRAPRASSARTPTTPATAVRESLMELRRRLTARASREPDSQGSWRRWAGLARGHLADSLALLLARLPKPRTPRPPRRTLTVFVAPLTERPYGSAPR
ncbi:hypothetical protein ACFYWX_14230 [Streptomyces sp. NPDC002888]|uniref:hypothetical protein n=1 Tax=Streptomyces sp. NPDC002888 TaxID=3364668 RepID=UPI0036B96ADC